MKKIYFIFFNILTIIIYLIFYTACSTTQERDEKESLYEVEKKESALEWGLRPDSAKSSTEGIEPKVKFKTAKEKIGEKVAAGRAKTTGKSRKMRRKISSDSGLKAGFADDNKQFNYFINFLNKYKNRVKHYPINITERIILKIFDKNQKPIPNVKVAVYSTANKLLCRGLTYSDGTFLFFPSQYAKNIKKYKIKLTYLQNKKEFVISRYEKRKHNISFNIERKKYKHIPLDILFIFDTTGSMGEEINRLKATLELIYINLEALKIKPKLRFGMVLYRDKLDEYITKVIPLTENLEKFRKEINKIEADGGGDTPEDLQSALKDAMKKIKWNKDGIRLGFIITDAPPHLDYGQKYTYVDAAKDAYKRAIKLFSIGTGGLDITGEYILRQISQYTYAKYIFLTYGEQGESEGGKPGSVSHHTGANYQTDKLESIIIRIVKEELSNLTQEPLDVGEEYFEAVKLSDEEREETLQKLFNRCISQLIDYSTINIKKNTPTGVIPFLPENDSLSLNAEYFTEQFILCLSKNKIFKMVERKDIQEILKELELQMTGLIDEKNTEKIGKLIGAKLLITGKLYSKDEKYELFLKLLRVETGEVLSVTKAKMDKQLGLSK